MNPPPSRPVLSCAEARAFERRFFGGDEAREWAAMQQAGAAIAEAVLRDFREIGGFPAAGTLLVLAGKGHNGGDALIAARRILEKFPAARAEVILVFGARTLRPLAQRAWQDLAQTARERVTSAGSLGRRGSYDLCLDGVFGFQFRPPVPPRAAALFRRVNALPVRLRAAVDLPSGLGEDGPAGPEVFRADFTYATGSVKRPVVDPAAGAGVGRLRYLDLGFFDAADVPSRERILTPSLLDPLRALRSPESDKRTYGHLFLLGGSHGYPGAILMSVLAALRSGVGLLTACVPESLAPAFAARAPEAMWVGLPETPDGGLALEGRRGLLDRLKRATALALGPGLGREPETLMLVKEVVAASRVPLLIDADALQPDIVGAGTAPRILTPHAGEWERIKRSLARTRRGAGSTPPVIVHKGRLTVVSQRKQTPFISPFGGPVLARGGSGDVLTGLTGGLLAQTPDDPLLAACRGVVWHGEAADALARAQGQTAVRVTQLLEYLHAVLHGG
jgi:NAD(P)H-hydrate epimerase